MREAFKRNLRATAGFFGLRFVVCIGIAIAYLIIAAGIQFAFVSLLGESTFNYIAGGLLSLLLGILFLNLIGSLIFMFVRGWHVAALAYSKKILRSGAPAVTVGMKVFRKNLVSFAAVYGVRAVVRNLLSNFKDSLWELLEDVPLLCNLQSFAESPIVEHMARTVLDYGFDATVYYLIKHKPESLDDVPSTVLEGLKRYMCALPSIMATSIGTYLTFDVLPRALKIVLIIFVGMTQGVCAGVLITVLLWPLFYVIENALFKPLTMIMFLSCFAAKCEEEVDEESPVAKLVESILEGEYVDAEGKGQSDDSDGGEQEDADEEDGGAGDELVAASSDSSASDEPIFDVEPDLSELSGATVTSGRQPSVDDIEGLRSALAQLNRGTEERVRVESAEELMDAPESVEEPKVKSRAEMLGDIAGSIDFDALNGGWGLDGMDEEET